MNQEDQILHSLKIQFGIPPKSCTRDNLNEFLKAYNKFKLHLDSKSAWNKAVSEIQVYFPGAGSYKYGSLDHTDLKYATDKLLSALNDEL